MASKSILILGSGIAGVVAANRLRRMLSRENRIILVDKEVAHSFTPSYLLVMMGWREQKQITRDLRVLAKKGIEFVPAEVLAIDPTRRVVNTSTGELGYDYLLVALGAELHPELVPGFTAAHNLYDLRDVLRLREDLRGFTTGQVAIVVSSLPFKCPAAPYEAAFLLDYHFRKLGRRDHINIAVYTPETLPMPTAGSVLGNALLSRHHPSIAILRLLC
ncbi:MAG: NAD(P)/FAD-dependent oxidoreductase [Firmicutes bacterium]|nr:NAD(P)/FAD-dependent oxidoreductase [Bacillota bacterium]MCL5039283.1 NAD(P)/FAD-dependent oxidoreductase [Bacillota bacterium]